MRLEIVSSFCRFVELRDDWNRLAGDIPMRQWEWAYTWAETMMGDGQLMLLIGQDTQGKTIAIAPFYRCHDWMHGDAIRFLGDRRCCTDYTTILSEPGDAVAFVDSVAQWLADHSVGSSLTDLDALKAESDEWLGWDSVVLQAVDQSDPVMKHFTETMSQNNCTVKARESDSCWQLDLPDSWEQYVQQLSKSQRRNVRLVQRRVLDADDVKIHHATDRESLHFAMKWFRDLHQKRWDQEGKAGCFSDPAFTNFLQSIATRMFETGRLRMLWIEKKRQPIAVDFSFLSQEASYGYQMGIDPEYQNQEIGRALMVAAMQSTHASGRKRFDFLRGDESYKSRWAATSCPLMNIEILPDRSLPQLRSRIMNLGRKAKRRLRSK